MNIEGLAAATLIGISLALMGGGGSILTVPVLVYLFGLNSFAATTYSLFIVGLTSFTGAIYYFSKNLVNARVAIFIALPSLLSVAITRKFLLPAIPPVVFTIGNIKLSKEILLLIVFASLMIIAAYRMIRKTSANEKVHIKNTGPFMIILQGIGVGFVTGIAGAGGGFLIIPVLVNRLNLSMKTAVGTSLMIISINSFTGFFSSPDFNSISWSLLLVFTAFAILGVVLGSMISGKINEKFLKPAFGWFVLVMGMYIILKETILG